jgi:hypothetical protein
MGTIIPVAGYMRACVRVCVTPHQSSLCPQRWIPESKKDAVGTPDGIDCDDVGVLESCRARGDRGAVKSSEDTLPHNRAGSHLQIFFFAAGIPSEASRAGGLVQALSAPCGPRKLFAGQRRLTAADRAAPGEFPADPGSVNYLPIATNSFPRESWLSNDMTDPPRMSNVVSSERRDCAETLRQPRGSRKATANETPHGRAVGPCA